MKGALLRLLSRVGLLQRTFRGWERIRAFAAKPAALGPDGLPLPPPVLMIRVAGTADAVWFVEGGRLAEELIRTAVDRSGALLDSLDALLDFGCGCGRVLRRWRGLHARVCGSDLNRDAIAWCRAHLSHAEVAVNALLPPLVYDDASFDLVYALSVFTHLPVEAQFAWRDELRRVVRPGGRVLLSLHGAAYLELLSEDERSAYASGQCVVHWDKAAGSNLCSAFHPPAFVRDHLAVGWELIEHVPRGALGNPEQDLIILRRPESDGDAAAGRG